MKKTKTENKEIINNFNATEPSQSVCLNCLYTDNFIEIYNTDMKDSESKSTEGLHVNLEDTSSINVKSEISKCSTDNTTVNVNIFNTHNQTEEENYYSSSNNSTLNSDLYLGDALHVNLEDTKINLESAISECSTSDTYIKETVNVNNSNIHYGTKEVNYYNLNTNSTINSDLNLEKSLHMDFEDTNSINIESAICGGSTLDVYNKETVSANISNTHYQTKEANYYNLNKNSTLNSDLNLESLHVNSEDTNSINTEDAISGCSTSATYDKVTANVNIPNSYYQSKEVNYYNVNTNSTLESEGPSCTNNLDKDAVENETSEITEMVNSFISIMEISNVNYDIKKSPTENVGNTGVGDKNTTYFTANIDRGGPLEDIFSNKPVQNIDTDCYTTENAKDLTSKVIENTVTKNLIHRNLIENNNSRLEKLNLGYEKYTNILNKSLFQWPANVKLYIPIENKQILFSEIPSCLYVQAFLRICNLPCNVVEKQNASYIGPSGEVPVLKCDTILVSGAEKIIQFVREKGLSLTESFAESEKYEISAYISLVNMVLTNAMNFLTWVDHETFHKVTWKRFSSVHPWPLNSLLIRRNRQKIFSRLDAMGWLYKTFDEVCEEVKTSLNALSHKLEGRYFFGNRPSELDAIVFAHVYAILYVPLPKSQFVEIAIGYPNILEHCQRIIDEYFPELIS